ncbi:MAG: trypsin-like serine protease [Chloroflexaceae bacterium]|nr:trypsin-like serine protease [Chloroflexaceae bacterium]
MVLVLIIAMTCLGGTATGWMIARLGPLSSLDERPRPRAQLPASSPLPTSTALPVRPDATALEGQIEEVYRRVGPGVVNITNRSLEYDFFMRPVPREGSGSGFFYDRDGHIVTNYHVVEDAQELYVSLADGRSMTAQLVGVDPSNDLAVIKVDLPPGEVTVVPVNEAYEVRVGQFVVAIGNPFGLERTLTLGVVSSLGRVIESPNQRFIGEAIQTDAAVNPGNSGGPLLNLAGEVVGVNSAILSPSGASAGIGFAIPASTVQRVVPSLIATGRYPHPSLGVKLFELTTEWIALLRRAGMDIPVEQGLLVVETPRDSTLRSGTQQVRVGHVLVPIGGDIIVAVDGKAVSSVRDLMVLLETQTAVGQTVQVTVVRDGREQTVPVTLRELAQ